MRQTYERLIEQYENEGKQLHRRSLILGILKLAALLFFLYFIWDGLQGTFGTLHGICIGIFGICSVPLWIYHVSVTDKIKYLNRQVTLAQDYLKRMTEEWKDFPDTGAEFVNIDHPYSYDLDIFGTASLFQLINVTKTYAGRHQLTADLSEPSYTGEQVLQRQKAIGELSQKQAFLLSLQNSGGQIQNGTELPKLLAQLQENKLFLKQVWLKKLLHFFPGLALALAITAVLTGNTVVIIIAACALGLQTLAWLGFSLRSNKYLAQVDTVKYTLEEYAQMFRISAKEVFKSKLLCSLQENMGEGKGNAAKAISDLDSLVQRVQARGNILLLVLLNVLFLWDIQCCLSLEYWRLENREKSAGWFRSLGTLESLASLATLCQVTSGIQNPCLQPAAGPLLQARRLGHPLIPVESRVCNDFKMGQEIIVLSGSNMSGKTTFLRTLGINLVLAKCGCGVCAEEFSYCDVRLISSMRISDNLTQGVSTFYAELRKIKEILELARREKHVLFLIDEIFRGTNSADRTAGAKQVMKKLSAYGAAGLMTTHDLKLCEDFEQVQLHNYHFSEQYHKGELSFDYTLKEGIAKSTNGRYLMGMLGFFDADDK